MFLSYYDQLPPKYISHGPSPVFVYEDGVFLGMEAYRYRMLVMTVSLHASKIRGNS